MKILPKYNSGQALLLTLFSMAVVLTIALSVISRTITDISVTTGSEDSLRAFSAAEAGVEQAIIAGVGDSGIFANNASYTSTVSDFYSGESEFIYPFGNLSAGESGIIWFVSHDEDGNMQVCNPPTIPCYDSTKFDVCWGKPGIGLSAPPAIEVSIFYYDDLDAKYRIYRAAIDPNSARRASNNFIDVDSTTCTIDGTSLSYLKTIDVGSGIKNLKFARIRFLYNTESQPFGVKASVGSTFPSQGRKIDSQGKAGTSNRRVEVLQGYGELPVPFAHALFSEGGLSQ